MTYTSDLVSSMQTRLSGLGWYRGLIDGKAGPMTELATSDFKAAVGLRERPFPGLITMTRLWSPDAPSRPVPQPSGDRPAWLVEAERLLGTREVPGPGNNPEIMRWARDLDQWYPGDDVPWCGLFVGHCMAVGAPDEPQHFNRLGARQWLEYGEPCEAELGSICVLWRTHKTRSWHGHVFIVTGQSSTAIRGIGGNQSNAVTEAWFSRDRVLGFRKPTDAFLVAAPRATTGALSTNEA